MVSSIIPFVSVPQIVVDSNVFVTALLSQKGASYLLLTLANSGLFKANLSVPLVIEYEDAANRILSQTSLTKSDLSDILDYICMVSNQHEIFFLWRPTLRDPKDDMILELAVASESQFIVTFNQKDFSGIEQFGLKTLTPKEFLQKIGKLL